MPNPQEYSITYGNFLIGGASDKVLHAKHSITESYETGSFDCEIIVRGDNEDIFVEYCKRVEDTFRTDEQKLVVRLGSRVILEVDPAVNSGYNTKVRIAKRGDNGFDTARSRRYNIIIDYERPASITSKNGRRDSNVDVQFGPQRKRKVTISGTYTALGANNSRAQYDAASATYFAAILNALGGTYEKTAESVSTDENDKNCQFNVVYDELIFAQGSGGTDVSAIIAQNITISKTLSSPGDSLPVGQVNRMQTAFVSADMYIDKATTALVSYYESNIKPYIANILNSQFGLTAALMSDQVQYDLHNNRIMISQQWSMILGSGLVEFERVVDVLDDDGVMLVPQWNNNPRAKLEYKGPEKIQRTITDTSTFVNATPIVADVQSSLVKLLGNDSGGGGGSFFGSGGAQLQFNGSPAASLFSNGGGIFGNSDGGGGGDGYWRNLQKRANERKRYLGVSGGSQINLLIRVETLVQEWVEKATEATGLKLPDMEVVYTNSEY